MKKRVISKKIQKKVEVIETKSNLENEIAGLIKGKDLKKNGEDDFVQKKSFFSDIDSGKIETSVLEKANVAPQATSEELERQITRLSPNVREEPRGNVEYVSNSGGYISGQTKYDSDYVNARNYENVQMAKRDRETNVTFAPVLKRESFEVGERRVNMNEWRREFVEAPRQTSEDYVLNLKREKVEGGLPFEKRRKR